MVKIWQWNLAGFGDAMLFLAWFTCRLRMQEKGPLPEIPRNVTALHEYRGRHTPINKSITPLHPIPTSVYIILDKSWVEPINKSTLHPRISYSPPLRPPLTAVVNSTEVRDTRGVPYAGKLRLQLSRVNIDISQKACLQFTMPIYQVCNTILSFWWSMCGIAWFWNHLPVAVVWYYRLGVARLNAYGKGSIFSNDVLAYSLGISCCVYTAMFPN